MPAPTPLGTEPSAPTGCIVVLEPGAKWPTKAFAQVPHRDGVAVVHVNSEDKPEHFFKRLARQFTQLSSGGVLIRTVLVACAMSSSVQTIDRSQLARYLQRSTRGQLNAANVMFVQGDD